MTERETELQEEPGPGTVNADYCGSKPPKKRGTLVRRKMRNYFFSFPSKIAVHCTATMHDGGHLTCSSSRPCWCLIWGPQGTRAAQTQTKPILTQWTHLTFSNRNDRHLGRWIFAHGPNMGQIRTLLGSVRVWTYVNFSLFLVFFFFKFSMGGRPGTLMAPFTTSEELVSSREEGVGCRGGRDLMAHFQGTWFPF